MKKILSFVLMAAMTMSLLSIPAFAFELAGQDTENSTIENPLDGESSSDSGESEAAEKVEIIDYVTPYDNGTGKNPPTGNTYIVYQPVVEPSGAKSPVIVVMGEEQFTIETATQTVDTLGLKEFCEANQCYAVFLGPEGETWAESDMVYYDEAINLFGEVMWFRDRGLFTNAQLVSSQDVIYVLAEGSAADFVCDYVLNEDNTEMWADYDTPDFTFSFSHVPAAVLLSNPSSDGSGIALADIGIVAVVVNGNEDLVNTLVTADNATVQEENVYFNPSDDYKKVIVVKSDVTEGFDGAAFTENAVSFVDVKRGQSGETFPLEANLNWDSLGIDEYKLSLATSETNTINYQVYIPRNIDTSVEGSVPLVLSFHGGGESADINMASTRYAILGRDNGFMTIAVDQHAAEGTTLDDSNFEMFIQKIFSDYPFIDRTRVYASGMSMGAMKTWLLGMTCTEYFAALAPFGGVTSAEVVNSGDTEIPVHLAVGRASTMVELPVAPDTEDDRNGPGGVSVNEFYAALLARNNITDNYEYDAGAGTPFGIEPDYSYATEHSNGYYIMHHNFYADKDGNNYTVLCETENLGHECYPFEAEEAWKFLQCFSKVDGEIVFENVSGYFDIPEYSTAGSAEPDADGAEEADVADIDAPAQYTQYKVFDGTYGFGDAEITVAANDDLTAFYITYISFDEDQILEGTVEDGIVTVTYDLTGFMAGDCQLIWDDAMASANEWVAR